MPRFDIRIIGSFWFMAVLVHAANLTFAQAAGEIVVDTRGGVQVISVPQPSPLDGLLATKLFFRSEDPSQEPASGGLLFAALLGLLYIGHRRKIAMRHVDRFHNHP